MKKLIIFDLFGVVIDSHSQTKYNIDSARRDIANYCNLDLDSFLPFFSDSQFGTTPAILFEKLIQRYIIKCKSNITTEELKKIYKTFYSKISCYEDVIKFIEKLQNKKICETAILSKLCVLDKSFIEEHLDLDKFDYLSCDMEIEKPNIEVYKYVEKISKYNSSHILLIDDNLKNIQVAQNLGWNICQATGDELDKICAACKSFLGK